MAPCKLDPRLAAALVLATLSATCDKPPVYGTPGAAGSSGQGGPGPSTAPPGTPPPFNPPPGPGPGTGPAPGPATGTGDVGKECAREVQHADKVPLDLMVLMDVSNSMGSASGGRTRWEGSQLALSSFVRDPASAGLGVGLQFFPARPSTFCNSDQDCTGPKEACRAPTACPGSSMVRPGGTCRTLDLSASPVTCSGGVACEAVGLCSASGELCTGVGQACPGAAGTCDAFPKVCVSGEVAGNVCLPATYETPASPIEELPASQPHFLGTLVSRFPVGTTPMRPAVQGALAHLKKRLLANPDRRGALLLVNDGFPSDCSANNIPGVAADLAAAFQSSPSIPTYVIGVFGKGGVAEAQVGLDPLASAGGTNTAIIVEINGDLSQRLLTALGDVRKAALTCEYRIPRPTSGAIDFSKVNLRYTEGATSELLPYVETADRCDPVRGGWYYDVPPARGTPTRVITCDASCGRLKTSKTGKVDLVFGCVTIIE